MFGILALFLIQNQIQLQLHFGKGILDAGAHGRMTVDVNHIGILRVGGSGL